MQVKANPALLNWVVKVQSQPQLLHQLHPWKQLLHYLRSVACCFCDSVKSQILKVFGKP